MLLKRSIRSTISCFFRNFITLASAVQCFALLENFFFDRSQIVRVENFKSSRVMMKAGVPRGSVRSSLRFNLYVNDISTRVSNCRIFQYADDTVLLSRHPNYEEAIHLMTKDATQLMVRFHKNLIRIHMSKT